LNCEVFGLVFVDCGETSVGVGEDRVERLQGVAPGAKRGIYNARGASQLRMRKRTQFRILIHLVLKAECALEFPPSPLFRPP
jgi:hypothetical protein